MTAGSILARADRIYPNAAGEEEKLQILYELACRLAAQLPGYDAPEAPFTANSQLVGADGDAELYLYYLLSRLLAELGELARYQNAAALYNSAYLSFTGAWIRQHAPQGSPPSRY